MINSLVRKHLFIEEIDGRINGPGSSETIKNGVLMVLKGQGAMNKIVNE
jgi:hypothetical protein